MKKLSNPNSQISLVLFKLIDAKKRNPSYFYSENGTITLSDFNKYPRISSYINTLRKKHFLEIETIMVKFTTQFGTKSEYASYKLKSETKFAIEVFEKLISK